MKKLAGLFLFVATASAFADTGNELATGWEEYKKSENGLSANHYRIGHFSGYVIGVADASSYWCPPSKGLTQGQLHKIVGKYIDNNPQKLHMPAASVVMLAFKEAFPCPK
ncbi:Rap1a/Tai family immunity protein [Noviherbaspirillum galbum]|uniref:Rap1a immunity protein domain-containing protein n=1 Tax=Noviherbaspirillum galbum TaxID=2709383 RepID=A0A6B3SS66_9BURK|nr:Rap1a/Tai family immunity protein [Noviherbaspirillum galbum]NEX63358.1 hypothetical protein [Noviherbaspirillum galbum]